MGFPEKNLGILNCKLKSQSSFLLEVEKTPPAFKGFLWITKCPVLQVGLFAACACEKGRLLQV